MNYQAAKNLTHEQMESYIKSKQITFYGISEAVKKFHPFAEAVNIKIDPKLFFGGQTITDISAYKNNEETFKITQNPLSEIRQNIQQDTENEDESITEIEEVRQNVKLKLRHFNRNIGSTAVMKNTKTGIDWVTIENLNDIDRSVSIKVTNPIQKQDIIDVVSTNSDKDISIMCDRITIKYEVKNGIKRPLTINILSELDINTLSVLETKGADGD